MAARTPHHKRTVVHQHVLQHTCKVCHKYPIKEPTLVKCLHKHSDCKLGVASVCAHHLLPDGGPHAPAARCPACNIQFLKPVDEAERKKHSKCNVCGNYLIHHSDKERAEHTLSCPETLVPCDHYARGCKEMVARRLRHTKTHEHPVHHSTLLHVAKDVAELALV